LYCFQTETLTKRDKFYGVVFSLSPHQSTFFSFQQTFQQRHDATAYVMRRPVKWRNVTRTIVEGLCDDVCVYTCSSLQSVDLRTAWTNKTVPRDLLKSQAFVDETKRVLILEQSGHGWWINYAAAVLRNIFKPDKLQRYEQSIAYHVVMVMHSL